MKYTATFRTYDPANCASVGLHIQANKTVARIATRSNWQGSRERVWIHRCDDAIAFADSVYQYAREYGWRDALEHFGLTTEDARTGPPIR